MVMLLESVVSMPRPPLPRVLLVDPRCERRHLMRAMLHGGADVVGEADTRVETAAVLDRLDVDAVVLDIQMPVEEGLRTIADINRRAPTVRIVVCSFCADRPTRVKALAAGAHEFLCKPSTGRELAKALHEVAAAATVVQEADGGR